jgi:hypothetical protein
MIRSSSSMRADPVRTARRSARRALLAAAAALALLIGVPATEARAQSTDFEVGPWLGWAAGWQWKNGVETSAYILNAGFDGTVYATEFGGGYGGAWEVRTGSWLAFNAPTDGGASGEGGLTLIFTQTRHASFGTFAVRVGAGYGGDRETHVTATFWGGVRYIPARAGQAAPGPLSKVTGCRIVATVRRIVDPFQSEAILLGVEFDPDWFLPPYSLHKWGGKH